MIFAARLDGVGYIWIDALWINQDDQSDWLRQSAEMDRIYRGTYPNIFATASLDNEGGLFKSRDPSRLNEEPLTVNVEGLPGAVSSTERHTGHNSQVNRRCSILPAGYLFDRVDKTPFNARGWVLQERLMSPRILHFCHDHIVWECQGIRGKCSLAAGERKPTGLLDYRLTDGSNIEIFSKGAWIQDDEAHGPITPATPPESDRNAAMKIWAHTMETYFQKALTLPQDRLIALSGLAELMAKRLAFPQYVAGLWRPHLEGQLTWYVESKLNHRTRVFSHTTHVPSKDCASSFSWASIIVGDHTLVYANFAEQRYLIEIDEVVVRPVLNENPYGLISEARIVLWCRIREAILHPIGKGRCEVGLSKRHDRHASFHRNVFLDRPSRDVVYMANWFDTVYLVPVLKDHEGDIICLILRLAEEGQGIFTRIGIVKLNTFMNSKAMESTTQA